MPVTEMTPELLAHLTAEECAAWERAQKATPGPWVSGVGSWNKSHWKHKAPLTCATGTLANFLVMGTGESSADGEFCAHARLVLPAALLALAQLRAAVETAPHGKQCDGYDLESLRTVLFCDCWKARLPK